MRNLESIVKGDNNEFLCNFCNSSFALKRTLQYHIKTSKRCIEKRPKIEIKCVWCKGNFITREHLEKHYKSCQVDKDELHKELLNSLSLKDKDILNLNNIIKNKDKEIENLNNIIKDLTSKLNNNVINNTTTTNTTTTTNNNPVTYNITLNCGKPLKIDKDELFKIMEKTCGPEYITRGQEGMVDWFTDNVCRNEKYEVTLECTDKKRKIFRYIDNNDCPRQINGEQIVVDIREIIPKFIETNLYNHALMDAQEEYKTLNTDYINRKITDFRKPGKVFINKLVEKTYIESPHCLITKKSS